MSATHKLEREERWTVPPVFTPEMQRYYSEVASFQSANARRSRRVSKLALGAVAALLLLVYLLAGSLSYALPLVRFAPIFLWQRADGTVDAAVTTSSLPQTLDEAQIRAALWQYVRLREGYSLAEAQYDYDVVSAMSAPDVRRDYQQTHNASNKSSPVNKIGDKGVIRVSYIAGNLVDDRYTVRFAREVQIRGEPPIPPATWTATIVFRRATTVPFYDRITYNPAGIVVAAYPGAEQEGAR